MSANKELFTVRMRKATRRIHSVSDALVNAKFAVSLGNETVWGGGLFVFYHVFAFLEDAKRRLNMPELNKLFVHKILHKKRAFEEDLQHYLGENWRAYPWSSALNNYIDHLKYLEKEKPTLLLAYVYHLYLGLMSGGQILAKKRNMFGEGKPEDKYVDKMTDFNGVDVPQLKKDFRAAMDEIAEKMTPEEQQEFLEESNQVFINNNLIVNSVGGQGQVVWNLLCQLSATILVIVGAIIAFKMYVN